MTEAEHKKLLSHYSILVDRADIYRESVLDAHEALESDAGSSSQHAMEDSSSSEESQDEGEEASASSSTKGKGKGKARAKDKAKPRSVADIEEVEDEQEYSLGGKAKIREHFGHDACCC